MKNKKKASRKSFAEKFIPLLKEPGTHPIGVFMQEPSDCTFDQALRGYSAGATNLLTEPPIRILYVEDNSEQADLLLHQIGQDETFDIRWERTLLSAMEYLTREPVDVVLLDLGMPELEGVSSHTAIRAMRPDIPTVILTANESLKVRLKTLAFGASSFLLKQEATPAEVRACLRNAAARGRTD